MRTIYEEDEQELELEDASSRELNLSSTTLLAIFFGLVLVCGLFFGFGYTLGRRAPSEATTIEPTSVQAATTPVSSQPKPSAASPSAATVKPAQASVSEEIPTAPDTATIDTPQPEPAPLVKPAVATQPQPVPAVKTPPQVKPALTPAAQTAVAPTAPTALPQTPAPSPAIMVQIAAVSNPADAEALVSALHRHGYTASVHRQPTDTLNHVQIGPFATRAEALAMRQKLQADGYNAIMK